MVGAAGWLGRPLLVVDTETDGVDPQFAALHARIHKENPHG